MQSLVKQLMSNKLSRRGFITSMVAAGYSVTAAESALKSVAPFMQGAHRGNQSNRDSSSPEPLHFPLESLR